MVNPAPVAAALALLAAGCVERAAQPPGSVGWLVTAGADTVLVERAAEGSGAEGEMRIGRVARIRYSLAERPGGARLEARLVPAGARPGAGPLRVAAAVAGSTARTELHQGGEVRRSTARVARGTLPYLGPSVGLLEHALRSPAGRGGGGLSLLLLPAGSPVRVAVAALGRDSVGLVVEGNEWRLAVDARGRVLGGRNLTRGWTVRRIPGPPDAALTLPPSRLAPPPGDPYGPPPGAPTRPARSACAPRPATCWRVR